MESRNFENGASGSPPAPPSTPSNGFPTEGNPSTGVPATKPGAYWFYQVSEEIRNVILDAGQTPNSDDLGQLSAAIAALTAAAGGGGGGGDIEAGSRILFIQAAAPVGWTRDTSDAADNRMLRIVSSGTGGGVGGSYSPISYSHSHGTSSATLSTSQIPSHRHLYEGTTNNNAPGTLGSTDGGTWGNRWSQYTGGGSSHNHGSTGSASFTPRYVNTIMATKD